MVGGGGGGGGEGGTERRGRGPSNVTAQLDTAKMLWVFHSVVGGRFVVVSASVKDRRAGVVWCGGGGICGAAVT